MDFIIGLIIFFALAYLISGAVQFLTRKPYKCTCGYEAPTKEEILAHVLAQNVHKMME